MEEITANMPDDTGSKQNKLLASESEADEKKGGGIIDFDALLKTKSPEDAAETILNASYESLETRRRDALERFIDFVDTKIRTGYWVEFNDAYPFKRMNDTLLEEKAIVMLNEYLYPDIVIKLLKFMTRNIYDPDSNLFIANLITSQDIIKSFYDTYNLFKKDIMITDKNERALNVKRIQQFPANSDINLSSPLEAASYLKYVLEFLHLKGLGEGIFTLEDLRLSNIPSTPDED